MVFTLLPEIYPIHNVAAREIHWNYDHEIIEKLQAIIQAIYKQK